MADEDRNAEILRLNEEGRQNVFRLHRGEISDEEFEVLMKALQARVRMAVHREKKVKAGNGQEG